MDLEYALVYSAYGLRVRIRILQCASNNLECASNNLKCAFNTFILFTVHTLPSRGHHTPCTLTHYMRSEYFLYCIRHQKDPPCQTGFLNNPLTEEIILKIFGSRDSAGNPGSSFEWPNIRAGHSSTQASTNKRDLVRLFSINEYFR